MDNSHDVFEEKALIVIVSKSCSSRDGEEKNWEKLVNEYKREGEVDRQ